MGASRFHWVTSLGKRGARIQSGLVRSDTCCAFTRAARVLDEGSAGAHGVARTTQWAMVGGRREDGQESRRESIDLFHRSVTTMATAGEA